MMPVSSLSSPARGNLRPAPSAALPPLRSVRVLDQLRERLRLMHYSLRTEEVYAYWLKAFIRFHSVVRAHRRSLRESSWRRRAVL